MCGRHFGLPKVSASSKTDTHVEALQVSGQVLQNFISYEAFARLFYSNSEFYAFPISFISVLNLIKKTKRKGTCTRLDGWDMELDHLHVTRSKKLEHAISD